MPDVLFILTDLNIHKHHLLDKDWHISFDCIVVDPRNCTSVFLNAMNDINWYVFIIISLFQVGVMVFQFL